MPKEVRERVDRVTNCDDLAMNFLIAHASRTPPIKVPTNFDFWCGPRCGENLSTRPGRTEQRHACIQYFTRVYGYMPLLYTQLRTDPVSAKIP
ncbi:Exostosin-like 3 [Geodia barretti]|uniref:Exostosin-like 3 n=1 Tax=Geodia barretti TaxID=519541 RepID=A0AA35RRB1_GEOBA|nr:Exostosin-like 3 [Geodia barretti]